jgi:hypothetical protein
LPKALNSFLRLLKDKNFEDDRMTKFGLYVITYSTTLESNKSDSFKVEPTPPLLVASS